MKSYNQFIKIMKSQMKLIPFLYDVRVVFCRGNVYGQKTSSMAKELNNSVEPGIRRAVFPSSKPFDGLTVGHIIGPYIWAYVFLFIILSGNKILNFN